MITPFRRAAAVAFLCYALLVSCAPIPSSLGPSEAQQEHMHQLNKRGLFDVRRRIPFSRWRTMHKYGGYHALHTYDQTKRQSAQIQHASKYAACTTSICSAWHGRRVRQNAAGAKKNEGKAMIAGSKYEKYLSQAANGRNKPGDPMNTVQLTHVVRPQQSSNQNLPGNPNLHNPTFPGYGSPAHGPPQGYSPQQVHPYGASPYGQPHPAHFAPPPSAPYAPPPPGYPQYSPGQPMHAPGSYSHGAPGPLYNGNPGLARQDSGLGMDPSSYGAHKPYGGRDSSGGEEDD